MISTTVADIRCTGSSSSSSSSSIDTTSNNNAATATTTRITQCYLPRGSYWRQCSKSTKNNGTTMEEQILLLLLFSHLLSGNGWRLIIAIIPKHAKLISRGIPKSTFKNY